MPWDSVARTGMWIDDVSAKLAQGIDEQGGGSLPVHIKVTPDADLLV